MGLRARPTLFSAKTKNNITKILLFNNSIINQERFIICQKQPPEVPLKIKEKVLLNIPEIHRKIPVLESLLKKIAYFQAFRCFPVTFMKFLRTPILKNICQQLLLIFIQSVSYVSIKQYPRLCVAHIRKMLLKWFREK